MYAVIVELKIRDGQMAAFLPLIAVNAAASLRDEPGCAQFDICLPDGEGASDTVWLYELYNDAAAFRSHMQTAHYKTFDAAVADMVADKRVVTAVRAHPD